MTHPFRFGVTHNGAFDYDELVAQVRRAEDIGYSCFNMTDHLDERNAPLATITAAALATSSLRVGTLVLCNDFRHPVVLAKELAQIDHISGGRLEVGLGAGWKTADYQEGGITKESAGVRIARLAEATSVIEGCFSDGPFDFSGEYYTVRGLDAWPKPIQRPRPPLMLAGGGPKMLTLAAQRADIVAVNVSLHAGVFDERVAADATAELNDAKVALVRDAAGSRFDSLELSVGVFMVSITDDRQGFATALADGFGLSVEQALASPHALFGTVDECVAMLEERRERWGFSYITLPIENLEEMAPVVERLAGR